MWKTYTIVTLLILLVIYIYLNRNNLKIFLLNHIIVQRGILAPNCNWYTVSDLLLTDGTGVNLYRTYKAKYGAFAKTTMFNQTIYVVTDINYIKQIFDHSPDTFTVGNLKQTFFKSFMAKNVGVSTGCPWRKRRRLNEMVLFSETVHGHLPKYQQDTKQLLTKWYNASKLSFPDFKDFGKQMAARIVFNDPNVNPEIFNIFSEANSTAVFFNPDFHIDQPLYDTYINTLTEYMNKPRENSLVELCMRITDDKEEVLHQIPHFIFPIVGLYITTIPRLLVLLVNHPEVFEKVIEETYTQTYQPNNPPYLRKCILETLRLNNPVITTFRTLTRDYAFSPKHKFKKGDQFLILNNPVLREPEFYDKPEQFVPERWTEEMEKSYYAISFNQGPQKCVGRELAINLAQTFIQSFIKQVAADKTVTTQKLDTTKIPQIINPCTIIFTTQRS